MDRDGYGFEQGSFRERKIFGKAIDNSRWDHHEFRESSCATVVPARDAENLSTIAKVHVAANAVTAFPAIDGRVKCDAIALRHALYIRANSSDCSGCLVPHDDRWDAASGRAVVTMNVAAADSTRSYANQNFAWTGLRARKLGDFQLAILRK